MKIVKMIKSLESCNVYYSVERIFSRSLFYFLSFLRQNHEMQVNSDTITLGKCERERAAREERKKGKKKS